MQFSSVQCKGKMDSNRQQHYIISEFEKEAEEEPSLSQISIATTSCTQTNSTRITDNSSPINSLADQDTSAAALYPPLDQHTRDLRRDSDDEHPIHISDSALSRDTFPGMRVDEHHTNYVLMYDMLTGIRISVSRCQAKPARPLATEDYPETMHLAFDSSGNEFTPSSKYDFKFKDYSPWIFRSLREAFKIDAADYLVPTPLIGCFRCH